MENPVENQAQEIELVDAEQAPEEGESISSITETEDVPEEQQEQPKEPGWIKGRIDKAVQKALREQETRLRAEYDQRLAPLYESMMERQAQELVDSGEFKNLERAKEYIRLKNGQPVPEPQKPQAQQPDSVDVRAQMLAKQAQKIKANKGVDVMSAYNNDPNIKQRILSGEWDFYDVFDSLQTSPPPSPVRTPNGTNYQSASIATMTDAQFRRLEENLAHGRKYDMRK